MCRCITSAAARPSASRNSVMPQMVAKPRTHAKTSVRSMPMHPDDPLQAITYRPVGIVRSPFARIEGMPLQSVAAGEVRARVEIRTELQPGLRDLDGFSHLHLITHLHRGASGGLEVVPFLDDTVRGDLRHTLTPSPQPGRNLDRPPPCRGRLDPRDFRRRPARRHAGARHQTLRADVRFRGRRTHRLA